MSTPLKTQTIWLYPCIYLFNPVILCWSELFYSCLCLPSYSQKKATDPTRFTNRGGNLLKEEKQRSELHKSLPKVRHKGHLIFSRLKITFYSAITPSHVFFFFLAWKEVKSPDWCLGSWTGSWVSHKRPEVPPVCGRSVGAAPDREGEGETGEGKRQKEGFLVLI